MAEFSRTAVEVLAAEACRGGCEWDDMVNIAHVIDNRARAMGVTVDQVVGAEFDAYGTLEVPGPATLAKSKRALDGVVAGTIVGSAPDARAYAMPGFNTGIKGQTLATHVPGGGHKFYNVPSGRTYKVRIAGKVVTKPDNFSSLGYAPMTDADPIGGLIRSLGVKPPDDVDAIGNMIDALENTGPPAQDWGVNRRGVGMLEGFEPAPQIARNVGMQPDYASTLDPMASMTGPSNNLGFGRGMMAGTTGGIMAGANPEQSANITRPSAPGPDLVGSTNRMVDDLRSRPGFNTRGFDVFDASPNIAKGFSNVVGGATKPVSIADYALSGVPDISAGFDTFDTVEPIADLVASAQPSGGLMADALPDVTGVAGAQPAGARYGTRPLSGFKKFIGSPITIGAASALSPVVGGGLMAAKYGPGIASAIGRGIRSMFGGGGAASGDGGFGGGGGNDGWGGMGEGGMDPGGWGGLGGSGRGFANEERDVGMNWD